MFIRSVKEVRSKHMCIKSPLCASLMWCRFTCQLHLSRAGGSPARVQVEIASCPAAPTLRNTPPETARSFPHGAGPSLSWQVCVSPLAMVTAAFRSLKNSCRWGRLAEEWVRSAPSAEEGLLKEWRSTLHGPRTRGGSAERGRGCISSPAPSASSMLKGVPPGRQLRRLRTEKHMPCAGRKCRWPWEEAGPRRARWPR